MFSSSSSDINSTLESCSDNLLKTTLDDFSNNLLPLPKKDLLASLNNNLDYFHPGFSSCSSSVQSRIANCHTPPSTLPPPSHCDESSSKASFSPPDFIDQSKLPPISSVALQGSSPSRNDPISLVYDQSDTKPFHPDVGLSSFDNPKPISSLQPHYISL